MAADAIQKLVKNRKAIRRLMSMDSNGMMSEIYQEAKNDGRVIEGKDGITYSPKRMDNANVLVTEEVESKSKLPKTVLESFKANPGTPFMESENEMQMTSVLDGLELESLDELRNEKKRMSEQTNMNSGQIDYSLIKTIINECVQENVKKYVSAMTKKLLNESVSVTPDNVKAVKIGDKFSFITESGDVYEATLKFKTNINEHKMK